MPSTTTSPSRRNPEAAGNPGHAAWTRLLRGGRLLRWKGQLASCAPNMAALGGRVLALSITAALASGPVFAADRHWDANGTSIGSGGSGDWSLSAPAWSPGNDGVSGPYAAWNNAALDNAIFGGTAGTVTLGSPITVNRLTFNSSGYTLTGGTLTLAGATPTISTVGSTNIVSIYSTLAGSAGLTKSLAGTLRLFGANTFTGDIHLNAGNLNVDVDAALGAAGNRIYTAAGASVGLTIGGAGTGRTISIGDGGALYLQGSGGGSALVTGNGRVAVGNGVIMSNDASSYTGSTTFNGINGVAWSYFTSIGNLGEASSLGAPTTVSDGTIVFDQSSQYSDNVVYLGSGNSSNRNWRLLGASALIRNRGTGTLSITGDIYASGGSGFYAETADIELLGTLSGGSYSLTGNAGRTIILGDANTYTGIASIGAVTVRGAVLADAGVASSFGMGNTAIVIDNNGVLSYTGAGASSDRPWNIGAGSLRNDGRGALALSGAVNLTSAGGLTLGGSFAGANTLSGVMSGSGDLIGNGAGTWVLSGANTRSGALRVDAGTLQAGSATAFGTVTGITVMGGTLDLGGYNLVTPTLAGTGGSIVLGAGMLAVDTKANTSYAGSINGSGGLTKTGIGTLRLSGANTYTGATSLSGGGLALDFSAPGAPASNIIGATSTLNLAGGKLELIGADGAANSQTFNGLNITAGSNRIAAISGSGGSTTVDFGAISRSGGLVDFVLPNAGSFTTSNTVLGGWATVNGSDYAKVVANVITAFTAADYSNKDNAANWLSGEVISDAGGAANTPFFGTLAGSQQLGGLKYTAAANSTVTIAAGQTLGSDGTLIVAPSVGAGNQLITGGMLTGSIGGVLGVQQSGAGDFTIASVIVDNGGALGFTKGGTGLVTLLGASTYTGATTLSGGTLAINGVANAGVASALGAASTDAANLVLESGTLLYAGATASTDRGFTLVNGGPSRAIEVLSGRDLAFSGLVTSPDDAGFLKTGAGTLSLLNGANDYVGATTVNDGTLAVATLADGGQASSIGRSSDDAANLVLSSGTLNYLGATAGSNRSFTLAAGGGVGVAAGGATLTLSGTAIGSGGLRKEGAGTLILGGANTYAGATTVNGGTLRAGSAQAFGILTNFMTVNTGATLELGGYNITFGGLLGNGTVDLGGNTLTSSGGSANGFSGRITGTGGFTRSGSYTQTLSGCNNDYTGATTIQGGGTLSVDCLANGGAASGIGASNASAASLVFNNGTLNYTGGTVATDRGLTLQGSVGAIGVVDAAASLTFAGQIVGAGSLRKNGAGTLILSGNNTYTGSTQVVDGTLRAASANAISGGDMTVNNAAGATLDLAGYDTQLRTLSGGGAAGGTVDLGSATLTLTAISSGSTNYGGTIQGSGALVKSGSYTQRLSGCGSTYTGTTAIKRGVLEVDCLTDGGSASSIGMSGAAAGNLVLNGGTLRYVGTGDSTNRQFTLGASGGNALDASGTGAIVFTSTAASTFSAANTAQTLTLTGTNKDNNTLAALLTDNGSGVTALTKSGTGTWVLTNPGSTYTGITRIDGGVLGVDKLADGGLASSLGASSAAAFNLVIGSGSTLRYTGTGDTTNRLFTLSAGVTYLESAGSGAVVFTDTGPVTLAGNNQARTIALGGSNTGYNTLAGSIGDAGAGKTTLAKNDVGTWVLTGNNTYTGNTVVNGGLLMIGDGGTTGSVASDIIVANGSLAFNRGGSYGYAGLISGAGRVLQFGAGTTLLAGANSYTGATDVMRGTLLVNGNQSAATGVTRVHAGAALGGIGTLGGDVTVNGGTLAPGSNGAGTLTINGNLTLDSASYLAMQFGQAGTAGGALNDLIDVKGNLTLNGTLDVTETVGGSYGPGIYRILSYGGSLIDNGLDVGTLPSGSGAIQTSVAGQVNLLAGGNDFSFWDGDAGPKFDGVVNGGNGSWQNGAGNLNWTEANGLLNASYSDGTFAIFAGAAGNVTVDNSLGQVTAKGMQFATDGYAVSGNAIELVGTQATLRVGDGTAAGAGIATTINAALTGGAQLVKTDVGTLVLTGNNSYTGGTRVDAGTLRISSDANLGNAAGAITLGNGTLHATTSMATGRTITLTGAATLSVEPGFSLLASSTIAGAGSLTTKGGLLLLGGDNTYTGGTTIATGTLQIGLNTTTGSIVGNVANNGSLVFYRSNALTYAGAVSGTGQLRQVGAGTLTMTGNSSYTGATTVDAGKLVLTSGGQIDGTTSLAVAFTAGSSAETVVDGAGSRIATGTGISTIGTSGAGTLTVQNGGSASFGSLVVGANSGSHGTLNIAGANSVVATTGGATQSIGFNGAGALNILNGGQLVAGGAAGIKVGVGPTGSGTVAVSGAGSQWDVAAALDAGRGSVAVSNGGLVTADSASFAGIANGSANLLVTGAGSRFETTGALAIASNATAAGSITLADGGVLTVGGGTLALGLGNAALNIGGAEGAAAAHAGTLDATAVSMAAAGNRINFNHDDAGLMFSAAISGAGFVNHNGSGSTVLTGNNSYAGLTTVNAGSLYINGDQSGATWLTRVNPGATLGGKGTIGGDVFIGLGGALNPGDLGAAPGTLHINGDLTLAVGSFQNVSLGQANVPGGPLNDLVDVGGDLTLGGTLRVDTSAGGALLPGVYRVFNYAGSLSNSGWRVNLPTPDFYVQASINHQVNLVNTAGLALRYWDGDAGPKNNGQLDGGHGRWQANGGGSGNDNWTENGSVNAAYADGAFAVFGGSAGTVSVDGSQGAVRAAGMQFLTDGYVVDGDVILLDGGAAGSVIRVGDGTSGGATTTARIDAALDGNSALVKADMGTLVLGGANGYTGGTRIDGGTLQIAADANLGAAAGKLSFNGGSLHSTANLTSSRDVTLDSIGRFDTDANTTLSLAGALSGTGALVKDGAGALLLLGNATHTGGTSITAGRLQLGDGGSAGGLIGDIANDGTLAVNRADLVTLNGRISGSGAFIQAGSGSTVLTGANHYTGATRVEAGSLLVNGDQSAATGATTVAAGASLGGAGILGGNVAIDSGATLAPGSSAGAASTLTIKGNLSLASGATLAMQFGEANVEGGAYNDLVNVAGDLSLDGTLDVAVAPGGSFGSGIYRVLNYGGTLTDHGLALGAMPSNSGVFLQTAVAGQVNLVNGNGLTLNYWDGAAGPKADGQINGGDGHWQAATGNNHWTDASGAINATYAHGSYAIFTGAAGTVTVDNSLGAVGATGMQFASDGYRITGDTLALTGSQATIRVGDGSSAGKAMTATIDAALDGATRVVKADLGTLVLSGANRYTGGTAIDGGTLQVASDAALGDAAGNLSFGGGTLHTTADMHSDRAISVMGGGGVHTDAGTTLSLGGAFSGASAFRKAGDGRLVLSADSSGYTGAVDVAAGTLAVDGTLGGQLAVARGARLEGNGRVGALSNHGSLAPGGLGSLTVQGNYTGHDGVLEIATVLGDDRSASSRLVVEGATAGDTRVVISNRGGLGAPTTEGIKIIEVGGTSHGRFTLQSDYLFQNQPAVVAGAYGYRLYQGGSSTPDDGDWYLRSALVNPPEPGKPEEPETPLYQPGVPLYESYPGLLQEFNKLGSLQQRIGNRAGGSAMDVASAAADGGWVQVESHHASFAPKASTSQVSQDSHVSKLRAGVDGVLSDTPDGRYVGGLFVQGGQASASVHSPFGAGRIATRGHGLGATLTWYGADGYYVDSQAQLMRYRSDLDSHTAGRRLTSDNHGKGFSLSLEGGRRVALGGPWSLTPQAQVAYSSVGFDGFTDVFQARVTLKRSHHLTTRFGATANRETAWHDASGRAGHARLYGIANLYYHGAGSSKIDVAQTDFKYRGDRAYVGLGFGGTIDWADGRYAVYGEAQWSGGLRRTGDNHALGGTVGFRMHW